MCILSLFLTYLAIFCIHFYISGLSYSACHWIYTHYLFYSLPRQSVFLLLCFYFCPFSFLYSSPDLFGKPEGEVLKSKTFWQRKLQMELHALNQKFFNLSVHNHLGKLLQIYITILCSPEILRQQIRNKTWEFISCKLSGTAAWCFPLLKSLKSIQ